MWWGNMSFSCSFRSRALRHVDTKKLLASTLDVPWVVALSGTMVSSDPGDLSGAMDCIGSDEWAQEGHIYHCFHTKELF